MTVLVVGGLVILFFLIPYLTGNAYGFVFRKKDMGIVSTYLAGVAIVYACLTMIQFAVIKFKFDFYKTTTIYHVLFIVCIVAGIVGFMCRKWKDNAVKWDVVLFKKTIWILGLALLQGILYIVLKNPYFDNNALLETTKITMETGTIYEYNAFSTKEAVMGFPLSNKLMFLPVFYAYISTVFGINPALLFNFVAPVVTFVSFYMVMLLWVQKLEKEHRLKWELLFTMLVFVVQVGDGWSHSTAFRILHSGYTGEAIFFGILLAYALLMIRSRCYFMACVCVVTFPGLIKYDAIVDFIKGFGEYWKEGTTYGGMLLVYVLSMVYYVVSYKKASIHLLNPSLTICFSASRIWNKVMEKEIGKLRKGINAVVLLGILLMCGNIMIVSNATEWRSNVYGASKIEFELLEKLNEEYDGDTLKVMAHDEIGCWIQRLDYDMTPVVGYDFGGKDVQWYSYEEYDENHTELWESVHNTTPYLEEELMKLTEEIEMDYIVMKRITKDVPISNNDRVKCVYDTPSYLVYSVDKN